MMEKEEKQVGGRFEKDHETRDGDGKRNVDKREEKWQG